MRKYHRKTYLFGDSRGREGKKRPRGGKADEDEVEILTIVRRSGNLNYIVMNII